MWLIKTAISLVVLVAFLIFGATVKLGERTLFEHVARIWKSDETQDLVKGVKKEGGPVVDKVKDELREALDKDAGPAHRDAAPAGAR